MDDAPLVSFARCKAQADANILVHSIRPPLRITIHLAYIEEARIAHAQQLQQLVIAKIAFLYREFNESIAIEIMAIESTQAIATP